MSRLSFFVVAFAICVGCITLAAGNFNPPVPVNDGNFISEFFGSDTSNIFDKTDREKADKLIELNHRIARYTFVTSNFSLKRVPAVFCLPHNAQHYAESSSGSEETYEIDDCDWDTYAESLLLISFGAFIVAVIVFPFLFFGLILGRCCCFGKYSPTTQCCRGDPDLFSPVDDGYSDCSVLILFLLTIACTLVIAAGTVVGLWGSVKMTSNINDLANYTNRTAYKFAGILNGTTSILRKINNLQNISNIVDPSTLDKADKISSNATKLTDNIAKYSGRLDIPRQVFMYVTLAVPLVLMILVLISRFCQCWRLAGGMAFAGFILTAMSLVTFAYLYPISSGISDICVFLDKSLANPQNDTFINSVFSCGDDSVLSKISNYTYNIFDTAGNLTCSMYKMLDDLLVPCDKEGKGTINILTDFCPVINFAQGHRDCNMNTLDDLRQRTKVTNFTIGCFCDEEGDGTYELVEGTCDGQIRSLTNYDEDLCPSNLTGKDCRPMYCYADLKRDSVLLSDCSKGCLDENLTRYSGLIMNYTDVAIDIFKLYTGSVQPYLNCETAVGITHHAKDFICVNMIISVTPMYVGEILSAAGSLVGTFVALLSLKRFHKKYRKKYATLQAAHNEIEL